MSDNHMDCLLAFWSLVNFDSSFETVEQLPVWKIIPLAVSGYCRHF